MEKYIEDMCDESKELSAQINTIKKRIIEINGLAGAYNDENINDLLQRQLGAMVDTVNSLINYRDFVDQHIAYSLSKK